MAKAVTRQFEDLPAVRASVPLLVGLMGPSGSGKTFSALRLATGMQRVSGGDIYVIDTEARRALHYADRFKFRHLAFAAPFSPDDYLAAIQHCVAKGAKTIIVDSASLEHEGQGGVLEMHEAELQRMGGDPKNNFPAWAKPKAARRRLINALTQFQCNFIPCFRAKEKTKPPAKGSGSKEMTELGFMPIAGEEFIYEMTLNALLLPNSGGVPTWQSDYVGERQMIKLPEQFRAQLLGSDKPLSEDTGEMLARWAAGGDVPAVTPPTSTSAAVFRKDVGWDHLTDYAGKPLADASAAMLSTYSIAVMKAADNPRAKAKGLEPTLRAHQNDVERAITNAEAREAAAVGGDEVFEEEPAEDDEVE